jgi:hypothetical protein
MTQIDKIQYALSVAVEHLAQESYPRQNWGQFLSLIRNVGVFSDYEIRRWDDIYYLNSANQLDGKTKQG